MKETTDFPFPEAFENAIQINEECNSMVHHDVAKNQTSN